MFQARRARRTSERGEGRPGKVERLGQEMSENDRFYRVCRTPRLGGSLVCGEAVSVARRGAAQKRARAMAGRLERLLLGSPSPSAWHHRLASLQQSSARSAIPAHRAVGDRQLGPRGAQGRGSAVRAVRGNGRHARPTEPPGQVGRSAFKLRETAVSAPGPKSSGVTAIIKANGGGGGGGGEKGGTSSGAAAALDKTGATPRHHPHSYHSSRGRIVP